MRTGNSRLIILLGLSFVSISGCLSNPASFRSEIPVAVLQSQTEAVAPDRPDSSIMTYVVANDGNADLRLGPASTTCGCSKAAISPEVVPPGGRATVTVVGQPPVIGSRLVKISVTTNDPNQSNLIWTWNLVGHPAPPQLLTPSPVINLGIVRPGLIPPAESVVFDLLEDRETDPLLRRAVGDQDSFQVSGGLVDESNTEDHRFVKRTYRYTAQFVAVPETGRITRRIDLLSGSLGAAPWLTIPIRGEVLPSVRALPSSLSLVNRNGKGTEPARLIILADDHSGEIDVECVAHDPAIAVSLLDRATDRARFAVEYKRVGTSATIQPIQFRIRQPVSLMLEVPIAVTGDH